jgi:hypothetical protein
LRKSADMLFKKPKKIIKIHREIMTWIMKVPLMIQMICLDRHPSKRLSLEVSLLLRIVIISQSKVQSAQEQWPQKELVLKNSSILRPREFNNFIVMLLRSSQILKTYTSLSFQSP